VRAGFKDGNRLNGKIDSQGAREVSKKMPKCPKCKKEIAHVLRCEIANVVSLMYLDEVGEVRLKEQSFEPEAVEFLCPECNEKLFDASEDVENFLKGLPPKREEETRSRHR
jgi:uncharacterized protein with PIN domain